jgi:outer membrane protein TolC
VTLHGVRQQVNETFFAALRAQEHTEELRNGVADLEAQLRVAESRVREGAALGSEAYAIRAELLRRRQLLLEWETHRRASLGVLADLTGVSMDSTTLLDAPDLAREVADVRGAIANLRARPEFDQFARARELLSAQARLRGAQDQPRVSAFGRAGYGRPGLNPLATDFDSYWLAGVQLQWSPWTWGAGARDREVLALQQRIVEADERAFGDQLARAVAQDLATVDRLAATIGTDDEIIALRERIAAETRARFTEGAVTSAEYVDRQTDVLGARLTRAIHRTELAQARARVLTTLGIEVR